MKINIAELLDGKIAIIVPGLSVTVDEIKISSAHGMMLYNEGTFIGNLDPRAKIRYLFGSEGY